LAAVEFQKNFYILYPLAALVGSVQYKSCMGDTFKHFYPTFRASVTAFQAIAYEFVAEMTYPVPEGTSGGLMNWVSQVSSVKNCTHTLHWHLCKIILVLISLKCT